TARLTASRRSDSVASAAGSSASLSANRSPNSPSSSDPIGRLSETGASATSSASSTCLRERPVPAASPSRVGSPPSPASTRAALDALGARDCLRRGQKRVAADAVHQERQRVGRRDRGLRLGPSRSGRREDLDLTGLQLGANRGELLVLELMLERKRLEDGLLERAALLRLVEDGLNRYFEADGAQFLHILL